MSAYMTETFFKNSSVVLILVVCVNIAIKGKQYSNKRTLKDLI